VGGGEGLGVFFFFSTWRVQTWEISLVLLRVFIGVPGALGGMVLVGAKPQTAKLAF